MQSPGGALVARLALGGHLQQRTRIRVRIGAYARSSHASVSTLSFTADRLVAGDSGTFRSDGAARLDAMQRVFLAIDTFDVPHDG